MIWHEIVSYEIIPYDTNITSYDIKRSNDTKLHCAFCLMLYHMTNTVSIKLNTMSCCITWYTIFFFDTRFYQINILIIVSYGKILYNSYKRYYDIYMILMKSPKKCIILYKITWHYDFFVSFQIMVFIFDYFCLVKVYLFSVSFVMFVIC